MAYDSEDEISNNNSESEMKFLEISTRTDIRPQQRQDANTKPEFSYLHIYAGLPKLRQPSKCIGSSCAVDLITLS
jgi:hypothetical protein